MDTRYIYVANFDIFRLPRYNNIFCKNKIFQFSIYRILIKWLYTFPKKTLLNRIPLHKKNSLENEVLHIHTYKKNLPKQSTLRPLLCYPSVIWKMETNSHLSWWVGGKHARQRTEAKIHHNNVKMRGHY